MDGGGVVKYKVNYLTLSRYEEAHRRLNIDALASEGKMKGEALRLRFGFLIMNSALLPRGFSPARSNALPPPPLFPLNACGGEERIGLYSRVRGRTDIFPGNDFLYRGGKNFENFLENRIVKEDYLEREREEKKERRLMLS